MPIIKPSNTLLVGLNAICTYTGLSERTLKKMIGIGFPAAKLEGTWYSQTEAIEKWFFDSCLADGRNRRKKRPPVNDK